MKYPASLRSCVSFSFLLGFISSQLPAQLAPTAVAPAPKAADAVKLEEFVVTGVFSATEMRKATTAITAVSADLLAEQVALSADDMLLNVAGVFVNSSLGEIRGMVYSRGISADSSDGATGTYYVSMQEDGLPFTNVNFGNYGTTYFNRPDNSLQRVEAVRGGSASITSSNAPGGVFNFITKVGTPRYGGEVRTRVGVEGRWSPFYRTDLNVGGPLGKSGWLYDAGAFYRRAAGHRPAIGYPMNDGYVVRGNLFKDYGAGSIKFYSKYLNDKNHWYEYLLAIDPQNPRQFPGLSRYSTNLFPKSSHRYPRESDTTLDTFDTTEAVHSQERVVGVDWKHDFGNGWTISNNLKGARNWADWNSSAGVSPRSLEWPNFFSAMAFNFTAGTQNGRVPAGTYRFYDRHTNATIAEVTSNGSYAVSLATPTNPGQIVTFSKLPNQQIQSNTLWTNTARVANEHVDELMDRLTLTKRLGKMTFTVGGFFSFGGISDRQSNGGRTAAPLTEQPEPVGITWVPATAASAPAGTAVAAIDAVAGWANRGPVQLTNPEGFTALGVGYTRDEAVARQYALFFGHKWDLTSRWGIDWGFRAENYQVQGFNGGGVQNPRGNWDPTYGGADGNPLTLYDNRFSVPNPANLWAFDKSVHSFSWSAATNFVIDNNNSFYVRYADGEKAPDYGFFRNYTSKFRVDNLKGRPQTVEQWELGYRYKNNRVTLTVTPFWSHLDNILTINQGTEADGVTLYFPDPIYNATTSYGLELEGQFKLSERVSVRSVFTAQKAKNDVWKIFQAGGIGRDDDTYIDLSGKPADNNPDFILNNTVTYRTPGYFANLSWKHMGERAGNVANVIMLPRFNQFDLALGYTWSQRLSFGLNINNLTDCEGVMTWRGWGVNPADRQGYRSLPATGRDTMLQYVPIQPRAYFLTTTYKF